MYSVWLLLILAHLITTSGTPCRHDGNYAYAGLVSVPSYQADCDLLALILTDNLITEIPSGTFEGYSNLRHLIVCRNQLRNVEEGAFEGARLLEDIDLSDNDIQYLNGSFRNAESLTDINLRNNEIRFLGANTFKGAETLKHIDLESNRISHVNDTTFFGISELRTLTMANNKIETLSESLFAENRKITRIDLRNNRFQSLPLGIFDNLDYLRYIMLSGNRLISITFVFSTPSVFLQAENCDLAELPDIRFSGSEEGVIEMDLRYNSVECYCLILEVTITSNRTIKCVDEDIGIDSVVTCFNKDVTTVSNIATTGENNQSTPRRGVIDELNEDNTRSLLYLLIPATVVILLFGLVAFYFLYNHRRTPSYRPTDTEPGELPLTSMATPC